LAEQGLARLPYRRHRFGEFAEGQGCHSRWQGCHQMSLVTVGISPCRSITNFKVATKVAKTAGGGGGDGSPPDRGWALGSAFNHLAEWLANWGGDRKPLPERHLSKIVTTPLPTARARGAGYRMVFPGPRVSSYGVRSNTNPIIRNPRTAPSTTWNCTAIPFKCSLSAFRRKVSPA
jgi:hypothetical protein